MGAFAGGIGATGAASSWIIAGAAAGYALIAASAMVVPAILVAS